ncbi:MAG: hypothetical protein LUG50_04960 [Planctomycetaceae bacterium]|nr:hypothetical protein [Planctomycetaceae bacterium]
MSESESLFLVRRVERLESDVAELRRALGETRERIAKNSQRLKTAESAVDLAHSRISGVKRWVVGGLITIASMAIKYAWSLIESANR